MHPPSSLPQWLCGDMLATKNGTQHTNKVAKSCRSKIRENTFVITKIMWPSNHHQNAFVATQALGHRMYVMSTEFLHCL